VQISGRQMMNRNSLQIAMFVFLVLGGCNSPQHSLSLPLEGKTVVKGIPKEFRGLAKEACLRGLQRDEPKSSIFFIEIHYGSHLRVGDDFQCFCTARGNQLGTV